MLVGQNEDELTRWSIKYFKNIVAPHLPKNENVKIVEVGCGYGRFVKSLEELNYKNVSGFDISKEQINYAKEKLKLKNVFVADAKDFFKDENVKYDVVLVFDVLEHLEIEDSINLLKLIKNSLAPNGILILQVPNAMAPLSPHRHWDLTHRRAYTTHSMSQSLLLAGYKNIDHFECGPFVHGAKSFVRKILWSGFVKPFISFFMLIANGDKMGGIYSSNLLTVAKN